ncbi:hypothetical protein H8958_007287, partial [Nasalis larvatus]
MAEVEQKLTFRKFTYRGVDSDQYPDTSYQQLMQLQCVSAAEAEPRPAAETALATEAPAQGQEAGSGEAGSGEDTSAGHDHPARDGGQHGGRLQRQDLQPGGDQARDDRPLPGRVLHHLRAGEALPAGPRGHPLLPLHPPQV